MKTKLLKKVRKRFEINYYTDKRMYEVKDNDGRFSTRKYSSIEDAILDVGISIHLSYYKGSNKQKRDNKKIKVWYNK